MASKWAERTDGRPNAPWPADKLAGTPWILVPGDRALLSSFNRPPGRNPVMSIEQRQIADTVLAAARRAGRRVLVDLA